MRTGSHFQLLDMPSFLRWFFVSACLVVALKTSAQITINEISGNYVNASEESSVGISGTSGFGSGVTINISVDPLGEDITGSAVTDGSGNWSTTIDVSVNTLWTEGQTISVEAEDAGMTQSDTEDFIYDATAPIAFNMGTVTVNGGTVVTGYWNPTNTDIDLVTPIDNDPSLENGTVQLRANVEGGGFENFGSSFTILVGNLNGNLTLNRNAATFEALSSGLAENENVVFTAIITDVAGNATVGTQSANTVTFDETAPGAFTVGAVSSVGAPVVADYWNEDNTSVDITVPIANDATLNGGSIQLRAQVDAEPFVDLGLAATITGINTTQVVNIDATTFEALSGTLADGEVVTFNAILTDLAGNTTTGTASSTTLEIDQTDPAGFTVGAVSSVGAPVVADYWNEDNTSVDITVPIANDATLNGGSIQLRAQVDAEPFVDLGLAATITGINTTQVVNIDAATFEALSGTLADGEVVTFNAILTDLAGNTTTGTASSTTLEIDQTDPAGFTTGTVTVNGGTVVTGYWNPTNTDLDIDVPVANEATLEGGTIQLRANVAGGGFEDLDGAYTILNGDLGTTVTLNVLAATFEALSSGLAENENVVFTAIISDVAGNATPGTQSANTVTFDETAPGAFTVGAVSSVGAPVVADYWNEDNTSVDITVPIANDATLNGGSIQLRAQVDAEPFVDLGLAATITGINTTQVVNIDATTFEALSGTLADGEVITFNAILTDLAGNTTTGTASSTTLEIDQTDPAGFTTGTVTVNGGTVVTGYWNPTNTDLDIDVPVANEATLEGGTIQLRANVAGGGFEDLDGAYTILNGDLGTTVTLNVLAATFEALSSGLAENENVVFTAIISDVAGNATPGTQSANTVTFDETAPGAFTVGAVSSVGAPVVADYWNEDNTSVDITVPIANDATLNGGSIQLRAQVDAEPFVDLGLAATITGINTTQVVNIDAATFEALSGTLADGEVVTFNAILTDLAGNTTTGTASSTTLEIDQTDPAGFTVGAVSSVGAPVVADYWNEDNTSVDITVPIANDATLNGGSIQLRAQVDAEPFVDLGLAATITGINTTQVVNIDAATFEALSGTLADGEVVTFNAILTDLAGNTTTGTASSTTLEIDQTDPAGFTTGTVTVNGGTVVTGYWNPTNTDLDIDVPVANEATLEGGTIQLRANVAGGGFEDLDGAYTILNGDLGTTVTLNVLAATFEALSSGLAENENVVFTAIISDVAGNATPGTQSANTVTFDETAPGAFTVGAVSSVGAPVVADYWNEDNTSVDITVPIANDATLNGGSIQLRAQVDAEPFVDLGLAATITGINTTQVVNIDAATFEALSGTLADGEVVTFNAILTDLAGNTTTGTASSTTLEIDQTDPAGFTTGTVTVNGGTVVTGYWNPTNTDLDIDVPVANEATLEGGTIQLRANVAGGGFEDLDGAYTILNGDLGTTVTLNVLAATFEALSSGLAENENVVFTAIISDVAGNATPGTQSANTVTFDETAPGAFTVGAVSSVGAPVVADYWNEDNTSVDITVPIANDATLNGGSIQLRAQVDAEPFVDLGLAATITGINTTQVVNIDAATFEALSGTLADGEVVTFNAILTDLAGNTTTGTASSTTLEIDQTDPAGFTVGAVSSVGAPVVADYWNEDNTSVDITVPIANDATLNGGSIQLRAQVDAEPFVDLGLAATITGINTTQVVNIDATTFEALSGTLADGEVVTFNAILTDLAGNTTTGTASSTTLEIDQTDPIISDLEIQDPNNDGLINVIQITFSEPIDTDDGNPPILADFGTITLPDASTVGSASITDPSAATNIVTLSSVTGQATQNTALVSTLISGVTNEWRDVAGNLTSTPLASVTYTDAASPIIISVKAPADDTYTETENLDFELTFSELVSAVGTEQIALNIGGNSRNAVAGAETSSTTVTFSYTVTSSDQDTDGIGITPVISGGDIEDSDANNLATLAFTAPTLDNVLVDGVDPVIGSVSLPNSKLIVGNVATLRINVTSDTDDYTSGLGEVTGNIAGFSFDDGSFSRISDTEYDIDFEITEGGTDIAEANDIPLSITITDAAGNISNTFNTPINQNNDSIDANSPSVLTVSIPDVAMNVGDLVTATITTAADATFDEDYTVVGNLVGTIGGFSLTNFRDDGGSTTSYLADFTITDNGDDYFANEDIPVNLTITDALGNTSTPFTTAISQANDPLDANIPDIVSVTIPDVAMNIDDIVTATITVEDDDGDTYIFNGSPTIGGFPLTGIARQNRTTYQAQFTVTDGGTDVAAGVNIPVDIYLEDGAGNISAQFTTAIVQANDPIDANTPEIASLLIADVAMNVADDAVVVTIEMEETDTEDYTATGSITGNFGGFPISTFASRVDGDTYTVQFDVTDGGTDVAAGDDIPLSLTITDAAGNSGPEFNTAYVGANDPIDANLPEVSTAVLPTAGTYNFGENLDFVITWDEPVVMAGTERLAIEIGGVTHYATLSGGSTNATHTFTYTIDNGDDDVDGIDVETGSLEINGGTLADALGNPAAIAAYAAGVQATILVDDIMTSPTQGEIDVNDFSNITLTFSQDVKEPTVPLNLTTTALSGGPYNETVPLTGANINITNNVVTIFNSAFSAEFATGANIEVTIPAGAFESVSDDAPSSETVFDFTVDTDGTPPVVEVLSPADDAGAVDVSAQTTLSIDFDETIVRTSGNIELHANNGTDYTLFDVSINDPAISISSSDDTDDLLSIDLAALGVELSGGWNYYVLIDAGSIEDASGNPFVLITTNSEWNWSTEADDGDTPDVVSYTPADNSSGIDPTTVTQLQIRFDEPIQFTGGGQQLHLVIQSTGDTLYSETIANGAIFSIDDAVGETNSIVTMDLTAANGGSGIELSTSTDYHVKLDPGAFEDFSSSTNVYNETYTASTWNFGTDATSDGNGPLIITLSPADDAMNLPATTLEYEIIFDEDIFAGTGTIDLYEGGGVVYNYALNEVTISNNHVTIPLSAAGLDSLINTGNYEIRIGAGVLEDVNGIAFAGIATGEWNFDTEDDDFAPIVWNLTPTDDATGVALQPTITIEFNEIVQPQAGGFIQIQYTDGTLVQQIAMNANAGVDFTTPRFVSIDLTSISEGALTLSGDTEYNIFIPSTAIEDQSAAGANVFPGIAADGTYSFTTTSDATDPNFTISPVDGATTVAINTDLVLTFDEPVNPQAGNITISYDNSVEVPSPFSGNNTAVLIETIALSAGVPTLGNTVYTYTISEDFDGSNYYRINVPDDAFADNTGNTTGATGYTGADGWDFQTTTEGVAPTYTFTPTDGETEVSESPNLVLTFSERVTAGVGNVTVFYQDGVIADTLDTAPVSPDNTLGTSVFTYNPTLDGGTNYYVQVTNNNYQDYSTNNTSTTVNDNVTWNFTTATTETDAPTITQLAYYTTATPSFDAAGIFTASVANPVPTSDFYIVMEFSERVTADVGELFIELDDPDDLASVEVLRIEAGDATINNSFNYKGSVVSFLVPANTLKGQVAYTIGIEGSGNAVGDNEAFADASGNFYDGQDADETTYTFTTVTDSQTPAIAGLTPADDATGVALTTDFVITFDQPMNPISDNGSNGIVLYYGLSGESIDTLDADAASVTISDSRTVFTYSPPYPADLEGDIDFYVNILAQTFEEFVSGVDLPALSTTVDWNFQTTTGTATEPTATLTPLDMATGVGLRDSLFLQFNELIFATNEDITISGGPNGDIVINAVDVSQVYGDQTTLITIDPTDDLHPDSTYTVTFPDGTFEDASGNPYRLANWEFETESSTFAYNIGTGVMDTLKVGVNNVYNSQTLQTAVFIRESNDDDFREDGGANKSLTFGISDGFEFEPGLGTVTIASADDGSTDISNLMATITVDEIQITFDANTELDRDSIKISGLSIRYTGADPNATGTIVRTGGDADLYGLSVSQQTPILFLEVEDVPDPVLVSSGANAGEISTDKIVFCRDDSYDVSYSTAYAYSDVNLTAVPTLSNGDFTEYRWYRQDGTLVYTSTQADQLVEHADMQFQVAELNGSTTLTSDTVINRYVVQVNSYGTASDTIPVGFTILGQPDADVLIGSDMTVCSFEDITLGLGTNNALPNTPESYTWDWTGTFSNYYDGSIVQTTTIDDVAIDDQANPNFLAPQNLDTSGYLVETFDYDLDVVDNNGCAAPAQATITVTVSRRVPVAILSPDGVTFSESLTDAQPIYADLDYDNIASGFPGLDSLGYTAGGFVATAIGNDDDDTLQFFTRSFVGDGLGGARVTGNTEFDSVRFTPSSAGVGLYPILYIAEENATGCADTTIVTIEVLQTADEIFDVLAYGDTADYPNTGGGAAPVAGDFPIFYTGSVSGSTQRDFCVDDNEGFVDPAEFQDFYENEFLFFGVPDVDVDGDLVATGFTFLRYEAPGIILNADSIGGKNFPDSLWRMDLDELFRLGDSDSLSTLASGAKRVTVYRVVGDGATEFVDGTDEFEIYPLPTGEISNLDDYYCEDSPDEALRLSLVNGSFTSTNVTVDSLILTVLGNTDSTENNGGGPIGSITNRFNSKSFGAVGGPGLSLVFADLLADADIGLTAMDSMMNRDEIVYQIDVWVPSDDDPFANEAGGCSITITDTLTVFAKPERPTIEFESMVNGDTLPGQTDVYLFEYCEGETPENIIVPDAPSEYQTTIRWYSDLAGNNQISIPDGRDVDPFNLFELGTSTPPAGTYNFYFSQTSNDGIPGFEGCESELARVTVVIHEVPDAPDLDLVTNNYGDEVNPSNNYYVYEYCEGISILDFSIAGGDPVNTDTAFYDWYYYNRSTTDTVIVDAWNPTDSTALDALGQGAINAVGNVTATAQELFNAIGVGSTNTPPDSTYIFFVARRDDRNIATQPNFNGCQSEFTRIDIVVYPAPVRPPSSLLDTVITVSSATALDGTIIDYNDRIALTDILSSPAVDTMEYVWYGGAGASITAIDTVRSDFNTGEYAERAEIEYQDAFGLYTTLTQLGTVDDGGTDYYTTTTNDRIDTAFYIKQIAYKLNRITTSAEASQFQGCLSTDSTRLDVTIYPVQNKPSVGWFSAFKDTTLTFYHTGGTTETIMPSLIGDSVEFDFEAEKLTSDTTFHALSSYPTVSYNVDNDYRFKWYVSNINGERIEADSVPNDNGDVRDSIATASDLKIAGITQTGSRYFLVTQITDIESGSDAYDGSESPGTLVRVNIYDEPEPPAEYTSTASADPGEINQYYCETDDQGVNPLSDDMRGLRVISYDSDDPTQGDVDPLTPDPIFKWYNNLDSLNVGDSTLRLDVAVNRGDTITPAELRNDVPNVDLENTSFAFPLTSDTVPPGTYTYYVTQVTNKKGTPNATVGGGTYAGDIFFGVESDPLEITVWVRPVPVAPGVVDQTLFMCEDNTIPTFQISAPTATSQYFWFQHAGTATDINDFDTYTYLDTVNAQTYTPNAPDENIAGGLGANPGTYFFFASVISDIGLNNSNFDGCASLFTPDTLRVRPIPENPVTTASGNLATISSNSFEVYEYCENDVIDLFRLDGTNGDNADFGTQNTTNFPDSATVFQWYDFVTGEELNANTSENFNPNGSVDLTGLTSEQDNDFLFRVTQRTSIDAAEGFDGCTSDFTNVALRVRGLPTLTFNDISTNDAYCIDENSGEITITASSLGIGGTGIFSLFDNYSSSGTGLTSSGTGGGSTGTAVIDLDQMHLTDDDNLDAKTDKKNIGGESTTRNIYYRFTDGKGCKDSISVDNIVINPLPDIDFKIDDNVTDTFNTCLNDSLDIFAERTFFLEGFYSETGASIASTGDSDFKVFFDNTELDPGVGITSDVDALAEFSPLDARKSIDPDDEDRQRYDPTNTYNVTFTHTDVNGCTNTVDANITAYPLPFFSNVEGVIIANKACASETVEFEVDLVNLNDTAASFKWFVDNDEILTEDDLDGDVDDDQVTIFTTGKFVIGGGPKTIVLQATDTLTGCVNEVSETKSIGVVPTPRFKWEDITVNNSTVFSFEERSLDFRFSEYEQVDLTITNNSSGEVFNQLTRQRADFTVDNREMLNDYVIDFVTPGEYTAVLTVSSTANCDSTITRQMDILNRVVVPQEGILHTFDGSDEGWHTDEISVDRFYDGITDERIDDEQASASILRYSTWEWAQPNGRTINQNRAPENVGGNAWITNADGAYGSLGENNSEAENSWVYSPTFDITSMEKPSMSFNYASNLANTDGVVVQYSVDDGATWGTIGEFSFDDGNSGLEWYNFLGLPGNPGNIDDPSNINYNPEQYGWTTSTNDGNQATDFNWRLGANKIDEKDTDGNFIVDPANWANIRFRFALGSRPSIKEDANGNPLEGFAFDNFRIFDRQKVVLLETFSSSLSANSVEAEQIVHDRVTKSGPGTAWINYFTDLDGEVLRPTDLVYNRNERDPNARGGFYGISDEPTSVLDGDVIEKAIDADSRANTLLGWNQFELNKKELVEPEFDIVLEQIETEADDELRVSGIFTSLIDLPANTELSFRFVVIEDYITNEEIGLYSTTDTIRNVMRAILPDASGFIEKSRSGVTSGQQFTFEIDWTIDAVFNVDELRVITFVQNEETREIYQVAFVEIDGKANTVTGLGNDLERGDPFEIYPNPANTSTTVSFSEPWNIDLDWAVYDQMGREMKFGVLKQGQRQLEIQTGDLASGVYLLQLNHTKYKWEPRRLLIIHD